MQSKLLAAMALVVTPQAQAGLLDPITTIKCEPEQPTRSLSTITFTVVAVVDPSLSHWDQFLDHACPTPFPTDPFAGSDSGSNRWKDGKDGHNAPWVDHPGHESAPKHGTSDLGWYEVWYFERHGEPPQHWYYDHHSRHPYSTGSFVPQPKPTANSFLPGPFPNPTELPRPLPNSSSGFPPRSDGTSTGQPEPSPNPVQSSAGQPRPLPSSFSLTTPGPFSSSADEPTSTSNGAPVSADLIPSSTDQPESIQSSTEQPEPSSDTSSDAPSPIVSPTSQPDPGPSSSDTAFSSVAPSSPSTTFATSTTTSASPSQTCADISNGSFENNNIGAWYISDEITAASGIVQQGPDGVEYSFALIPSQQQFAQVYINQYIRCGDPPPIVDIQVRFSYQFTGNSEGCSIAASVNRSPENLFTIEDDGQSPGVWQQYEGPVISVQLTYDPLFTIKMTCQEDTANSEAILITEISVYN